MTFSMAAGNAWEEQEITLQGEENVKLTNCARAALGSLGGTSGEWRELWVTMGI